MRVGENSATSGVLQILIQSVPKCLSTVVKQHLFVAGDDVVGVDLADGEVVGRGFVGSVP